MCCVMPPASPSATLVARIASSSDVLPWSTCPIIVTTGARGSSLAAAAFLLGLERLLDVEGDVLDLILELARQQHRRVVVEHLVDGRHHAHVDELLEHLAGLDAHRPGEVADRDHLGDADDALRRARHA